MRCVDGAGSARARTCGRETAWVAGSTHAGEEEQVLAAHAELRRVRAALAAAGAATPAALRGGGRPAGAARHHVRPPQRRHAGAAAGEVLLVDSVGELTAFYAAAQVAFVGGSLVPVGGHNLLEPAVLGVPVITGPYTANSRISPRR